MFWHNKNLRSEEYEKLQKAIVAQDAELQKLKNSVVHLESLVTSLRGLVNRKISEPPKKEEHDSESKTLNVSDGRYI